MSKQLQDAFLPSVSFKCPQRISVNLNGLLMNLRGKECNIERNWSKAIMETRLIIFTVDFDSVCVHYKGVFLNSSFLKHSLRHNFCKPWNNFARSSISALSQLTGKVEEDVNIFRNRCNDMIDQLFLWRSGAVLREG